VELGRQAFRKKQNARSVAISFGSTLVFAVFVYFTIINTPGWERVQNSFFNLEVVAQA